MLKWQYKQDISETEAESEEVHSCETCGEKLVSVYTSVGEKFFHLDCFLCSICGVKIDDKFFLENGEILCENDYDKKREKVCCECKLEVGTEYLLINEKVYHQACFCCANCGQSIEGSYYPHHNGTLLCRTCYSDLFIPQCTACTLNIIGEIMKVGEKLYHRHCYSCKSCKVSLINQRVFNNDTDDILCIKCYLLIKK